MNSAGNRVQLFLVSQLHDKGRNAVLDCIVWIKVRSAGHDIPRSTDRWRPERDGHRLRKPNRGNVVARYVPSYAIPPPIDMSVFASVFFSALHSRHFSPNTLHSFDRSDRLHEQTRNLVVNVEKTCRSNTRLVSYRLLIRGWNCCLPRNWFRIATSRDKN